LANLLELIEECATNYWFPYGNGILNGE